MRIRLLSALAVSAAVAACHTASGVQVTDAQRTAITKEVSQTIDSLFADRNAHDVDRIYDHYRKSDEFLYVTVTGTMRSWKTFSSITRSFYTQHPDVTFQYHVLQTQVLAPNVAVATITGSATTSPHLTWTDVLVREGGRWVITLENEAWPGAKAPVAPHPAMEPPPQGLHGGTTGTTGSSGKTGGTGGTGGL